MPARLRLACAQRRGSCALDVAADAAASACAAPGWRTPAGRHSNVPGRIWVLHFVHQAADSQALHQQGHTSTKNLRVDCRPLATLTPEVRSTSIGRTTNHQETCA